MIKAMLDSRSSPVLYKSVVAMNPSIVLFLATFSLLQNAAEAVLPNGQCLATNMSCELESNNVIGIINGVANAEECSQECLDNRCKVFTYFGPSGVPFRDSCILLSDCLVLDPCEDCLIEDIGSDCTNICIAPVEAPVEGILGKFWVHQVLMMHMALRKLGICAYLRNTASHTRNYSNSR